MPVAGALVASLVAGYEAGHGRGGTLLLLTAGAVVAVGIILRPDLALMAWIAAVLADGRQLSQFHPGRIYVTEIFFAVLLLALLPRLLLDAERRNGMKRVVILAAVLWVPGVLGLAWKTDAINLASARNFAIVYYSLFAIAAIVALDPELHARRLLLAVLLGSTAAVVVAFSGISGFADVPTSTGARRIAHGSFSLPFGIAPLVLIAALHRRLIPWKTVLLIPVYLTSLVLVNHRSAWLAFVVAASMLAVTRLRPGVVVIGAVAAVAALLLFTSQLSNDTSATGQEIYRAKTIADTEDPNIQFRLGFWRKVSVAALESPLVGSGFDAYPSDLVPPESLFDPLPAPHNSFIALLYRIGPLPFALFFILFIGLLRRSFVSALRERDPERQGLLVALIAVVIYVAVYSAFNVAFETPYTGPVFWTALGLLAATAFSRATEAR
jgi:hypothetical protein